MNESEFKFFRLATEEYEALGSFLNDVGVGYELIQNETDATDEDVLEKSVIVLHDPENNIDADYIFDEIGVVVVAVYPGDFAEI